MGKPAVKPKMSVKKKPIPAKRAVPRPWSRTELKTVVSMLDKDKTVREIADKLNRHPGSVASKIKSEQLR
jgi:hypothetical protein